MSELKSKAPLPLTMYKIESEVFGARTRDHGTEHLFAQVTELADVVTLTADAKQRETAAVQLAAACVRIIEEIK